MNELGNKEIFSNNLKYYMSLKQVDRNEICKKLNIKYPTFSDWYNGKKYPRIDKIELLATYFGINKSDLIEDHKNISTKKRGVKIPVLGSVAAGIPIEAIEDIVDYEEIDSQMAKNGEYFGLVVKGQSMFPYIIDSDVVIIKKQNDCESGQIAVVQVNGDEATIKKVIKNDNNSITLVPFNTASGYLPTTYTNKEILNKPVKILGVLKELRRKNFDT